MSLHFTKGRRFGCKKVPGLCGLTRPQTGLCDPTKGQLPCHTPPTLRPHCDSLLGPEALRRVHLFPAWDDMPHINEGHCGPGTWDSRLGLERAWPQPGMVVKAHGVTSVRGQVPGGGPGKTEAALRVRRQPVHKPLRPELLQLLSGRPGIRIRSPGASSQGLLQAKCSPVHEHEDRREVT